MSQLHAESFRADPRVAQAKQLLRAALHEHSQKITTARPADADRAEDFEQQLADFAAGRGAPLFYRYISSGLGNGALIELTDGSVKYDFISGIGVHGWGHSHPDILETGIDAALSDMVMQGHVQQTAEAQAVMSLFLRGANAHGADFGHCFVTSSGAMANENAFKIAMQARFPAHRVLAFEHCFAGRTFGMSHVTDKAAYRDGIPSTLAVDHVPFYDYKDPIGSTERALAVLKGHLQRHPGQYALMVMELIQGEGGYYAGTSDFFRGLITVLKEHKVLVHIDEIQTFGRCETMFAFQYFGLDADVDIVSVGKMSQVCATMYRSHLQPRPGLIAQTFTASTSAIFAAKHILETMLAPGFFGADGRVARMSNYFRTQLESLAKEMPEQVAGPFGLGAMLAFTPLNGAGDTVRQFSKDLFAAGVTSFIAGSQPTRIRFLIPVAAVTEADIDAVVRIIRTVLARSS